VSFLGMVSIALKKSSALKAMPERKNVADLNKIKAKVKETTINYCVARAGDFDSFLQKFLLKAKVFFMKAENKASTYLQKLKERSENREEAKTESKTENKLESKKIDIGLDDYWKNIRTSIKTKTEKMKVKRKTTPKEEIEK